MAFSYIPRRVRMHVSASFWKKKWFSYMKLNQNSYAFTIIMLETLVIHTNFDKSYQISQHFIAVNLFEYRIHESRAPQTVDCFFYLGFIFLLLFLLQIVFVLVATRISRDNICVYHKLKHFLVGWILGKTIITQNKAQNLVDLFGNLAAFSIFCLFHHKIDNTNFV